MNWRVLRLKIMETAPIYGEQLGMSKDYSIGSCGQRTGCDPPAWGMAGMTIPPREKHLQK
jgi:hypothetical protein